MWQAPSVAQRRFRSYGQLLSWAEERVGGRLNGQQPWPTRLPTREVLHEVIRIIWLDGCARGRAERDAELARALGIGMPREHDGVTPHESEPPARNGTPEKP